MKNRPNRRWPAAQVAAASIMLALGAAPLQAQDKEIKAAWVYVGPVGDGGWTFAHDNGSFRVWTGPIRDQSGKELLAAGKTADDKFLHGATFYVEGVQGKVPSK